jgi:hypothetical protein
MCLQPFWNELSYERGKMAEKERQEQISRDLHSPDNITYEEYLREKNQEQQENPIEQCHQKFIQQEERNS